MPCQRGATATLGGKPHALGGTFYEPTILTGVTADMLCAREETFGPVAPLFRFGSEDEAVRMANDTIYGLIGYVFGEESLALRVALRIDAGMVGVNKGVLSDPAAPFGGTKQSGLGREGSSEGILEYLEEKYIGMAP